jgi:hypothetical protein
MSDIDERQRADALLRAQNRAHQYGGFYQEPLTFGAVEFVQQAGLGVGAVLGN